MAKFDAVVIGAGTGGLSAALGLAVKGKKVLLLEKHNLPGGCSTSFVRGRFEFDASLHEYCAIGSKGNYGTPGKIMMEDYGMNVDWILAPDLYRCIGTTRSGKHFDVTLPCGDENVIKKMEEVVPGSEKPMRTFFALADEIGDAHNAVCKIRTTGEAKMHLSKDGVPELVLFPQLPYVKEGNLNNPKSIQRLKEFGESLKYNVEIAISFGIGGSYLGNKVLFDVHCGEFWNAKSQEERCGYPEFYFSGNNIDPRRTGELINYVLGKAKQKYLQSNEQTKIALIVISKSGSTIDTMSNFMVAYEKFRKSEYIMLEVVAVTDPAEGANETLLKKLAKEEKWQTFSVPDGVGGRFSIFSEVGLVTAACIGFDIDEFLAGAKNMDQACQTADFYQNPALLNATLKYLAAKKFDRNIEVLMPYADNLKSTSEWYVQLLAESLGKRVNRSGSSVYY